MNMEIAGKLIEMNARTVRTDDAAWLIVLGVFIALFGSGALIGFLKSRIKASYFTVIFISVFIIGIGLIVTGFKAPTVKQIEFCADGPVQIEQIAAHYDIVDIDGKKITVKERRK